MNRSLLLIEDNESIRNSIVYSLEKENYDVVSFDNAEAALSLLNDKQFDLILLDLMLPGMNGEQFLQSFINNDNIPIIVISALNDEFTQINMYNKKIDDFVVKPFSMNILLLKIEAMLRRSDTRSVLTPHIIYKNIRLETGNYVVYLDDNQIELTTKEFEIIEAMLLNQGKVFSREELLTALWGYDYFVDSRTVDVHIKNLRVKLGKNIIETIKGVGYRVAK